ncbi:MAG: putative DNA binding domain-containing protein [Lachnospiraceae bacterium]|nr:putative DNA binding domain-containing protein [Lachnospiraceae bacterium]
MALPINISDLIRRKVVENARVEYKGDWNPEPILHSICAFANDIDNWGGGYIIIGIEEQDGMPVFPVKGLDKSSIDRINKELLQKCNLIEPRYLPVVEQLVYDGKDIIVLWVPGGADRPYKCPVSFPSDHSVRGPKAYYIRKMSNSIRANQLEERELFLLAGNQPFDDRPNLTAKIGDIRPSLLSEYLYTVESDLYESSLINPVAETAASMRLIGGPTEFQKPLNVGLMFFNERPDNFFPYARIEVVDKPDPTGIGMTEKIFAGPLDRQLKDALSYIRNYIIKEKITKIPSQAEAERVFNIPYEAVEEALSNAIYHKSYQIGEPITVMMTPEKMEITSLPGPDRTITDEDLANCHLVSRRYRNRRIGDFLKELKLVEGRNTGVPTILRAMERNGSRPPVFETDEGRNYFTIILPVHKSFLPEEVTSNSQRTQTMRTVSVDSATCATAVPDYTGSTQSLLQNTASFETVQKSGERKRRTSSEIKELALSTLKNYGEMSASELAHRMGYSRVTVTLNKVIRELVDAGTLAYKYPEALHSRNQKIFLVD